MDNRQAREILALYRPGTMDAADPQVAEALDLAKRDGELGAWFEQHCAMNSAIHGKVKSIPVPSGLKRKIIIERPAGPRVVPMARVVWWLAAAAAIAVAAILVWNNINVKPENTYTAYRARMVSLIERGYYMQKTVTNQTELRDFFASKNAATDYTLPKNVDQLTGYGGSVFAFNNHPVELLCLRDQTLPPPVSDVWVFVIKKSSLPDGPKADKPDYLPFNDLTTVSWASGDTLYLMAGKNGRKDLERYLE